KVLSALHGSFPFRFRHLQEKAMRVGGTIYPDNLRTFNTVADTKARNERDALAVSKFKQIGAKVWPAAKA
ncbi:hypothetical protein, partial [Marinobacter shengliensis]|uniref:hypothetical protein n=1 Tax=Marinobacter shengliensis TaxID=1389223 RepID=UPI001BB1F3CA